MLGELPAALSVSAPAETEGTRVGRVKKTVIPKTEEQLAAANRKQNLTSGHARVRKTTPVMTKLVEELYTAARS
eukprot:2642953-Heterocapsa_arctica.AAC.1